MRQEAAGAAATHFPGKIYSSSKWKVRGGGRDGRSLSAVCRLLKIPHHWPGEKGGEGGKTKIQIRLSGPSTEDGLQLQGYRLHSNCLPCRLLLLSQVASFDIFLFGSALFFLFLLNLIKRHSWPLSAADDSTDSEVTAADGPGRPPHDLPLSGRETRPAEMANDNPLGNVVKIIFITSTTKEIGDQVARQKPCQLQLAVHLWRTWRNTIASSS